MKRAKKLYILLGVLAAACLATVIALGVEEYKEQIRTSDAVILEIPIEEVDALSWEYEETSLGFHKEEDTWLYDQDAAFPVDPEKIEGFLERFEAFGVTFVIEDVEDYGQYGLEGPLCTIQLSSGDTEYTITLGDFSTMDSQRYVSIGDGNAYLVAEDPLEDFDAVLSDMILDDDLPILQDVQQLQFSGAFAGTVQYIEDSPDTYCSQDVYFLQSEDGDLPLDTQRVESYLDTITYLGLSEYATYNATQEELESYGLDTPELSIQAEYTVEDEDSGESSQETFVLHISRDPAQLEALAAQEAEEAEAAAQAEAQLEESMDGETETVEAEAAEEAAAETDLEEEEEITAYARVGDSQIVYLLDSYDYQALMDVSYDALRHTQVLSADFSTIQQLDFTLEDSRYTITAQVDEDATEDEEDPVLVYTYQGEELDITALQSAIEALSADSFTDERPTQKEEIRFTAHLDNQNFPTVEVVLYRYDGESCLAVVDGSPVSLVPRTQVVDLMEALYAIVLS